MEHIYKQFEALATRWRRDLLLRARVKLTAAYVGISAIVLAVFSYLLYSALLSRFSESINEDVLDFNAQVHLFERVSSTLQSQILIADGITIFIVLICGYVLTGITLRPIREARDRERRFLADAAHELRTPLSVMKSGNEIVLRGEAEMSPRVKKLLSENVEEIDSLTRIANGLLSLVSEKEKSINKGVRVHIHQALSTVVKKLESIAQTRQIKLAFTAEEATKILTVHADQNALARAFENLVENAIKYTKPDGSVEVTLVTQGESAMIQVRDTGIGIAPDDLLHVTEPFFRADAARTSMDGSGLGLSIVSETIESHGGRFTIESELGVGTIVRVTLPLVRA
jgi:signal transduction histidine kinase